MIGRGPVIVELQGHLAARQRGEVHVVELAGGARVVGVGAHPELEDHPERPDRHAVRQVVPGAVVGLGGQTAGPGENGVLLRPVAAGGDGERGGVAAAVGLPFETAIMLGGMGNACASPPATPVHSLKSPVSNRAVQRRSDPTSSWPHPAASAASSEDRRRDRARAHQRNPSDSAGRGADPEERRVPHGSRRQREDRRRSGDQLGGEGGERREARRGKRARRRRGASRSRSPSATSGSPRSSARSESSAAETPSSP